MRAPINARYAREVIAAVVPIFDALALIQLADGARSKKEERRLKYNEYSRASGMRKRRLAGIMGYRQLDITGQRFGRLLVFAVAPKGERGRSFWHCLCDCGKRTVARGDRLHSGATQSCGCLQRERSGAAIGPFRFRKPHEYDSSAVK